MKKILLMITALLITTTSYAEYKNVKDVCRFYDTSIAGYMNSGEKRVASVKDIINEKDVDKQNVFIKNAARETEIMDTHINNWQKLGCASILYK